MLETHTFDEDHRKAKCKDAFYFLNKYGNELLSIEWDRRTETRRERVPGWYTADGTAIALEWGVRGDGAEVDGEPVKTAKNLPDPDTAYDAHGNLMSDVVDAAGNPKSFVFIDRDVIVKDCPSLIRHDLKDAWFDASVVDADPWDNSMNRQQCLIVSKPIGYDRLWADQRQGLIQNVDKVTSAALFTDAGNETAQDRAVNAGESENTVERGSLRIFHAWIRVPIKENVGKNGKTGKGKWDEAKTPPTVYWASWVGKDLTSDAVCVRLIANPYHHKQIPFKLLHSHRDDKGAYHMGMATLVEPLYWQIVTNLNQACDNVTKRNRAPMVADGPIYTDNLTYKANKLIRTARGVKLEPIKTDDTTGITMGMHDILERDISRTGGADKPIMAEALGSRTSATEAKNIYDQALMPLDEQADYVADQLWPWMYMLDAHLWRQMGDPERVITVTHQGQVDEIQPAEIWGPIKVKVTAVSRFRNNTVQRQERNAFIQGAYPFAEKYMGRTGSAEFWKDTFRDFGYENAARYFPANADFDATNRAIDTARRILFMGEYVEPNPDENQRAHLDVLEGVLAQYALLPPDEVDPERLRMLREHITIRHQILTTQENAQTAQVPQVAAQQGLTGEIAGNATEAQEGALAVA